MRSSIQRRDKYEDKLEPRILPSQTPNYRASVGEQVNYELTVKTILAREGVMAALIHYYMDFGKQLAKLRKKHAGDTLLTEVAGLTTLWAQRGLDIDVLIMIREAFKIFGECFLFDVSLLDGEDLLC